MQEGRPPLPAILLGWTFDARNPDLSALERAGLPPWFLFFRHSYGGHVPDEYDAVIAVALGALLPLESNLRHGAGDLRTLIARLCSEDRAAHFHTRAGEDMSAQRSAELASAVRTFLRAELASTRSDDATEAMARLAGDPLSTFEGWAAASRVDGADEFADGPAVDAAMMDELARLAPHVPGGAKPGAFLLWSNCDD